jgi:hypothetical protein
MRTVRLPRIGLAQRRGELAAADLTNRRTHEANHNAVPLGGLLAGFRAAAGG